MSTSAIYLSQILKFERSASLEAFLFYKLVLACARELEKTSHKLCVIIICFLPEKGQKLNNKVQTCRDLNLSKFQWSYLQISLGKSRIVNDTGN